MGGDNFREAFLALVTIGPGIALVAYLVSHWYDYREELKRQRENDDQEFRQHARAYRQKKQRLRARRGN